MKGEIKIPRNWAGGEDHFFKKNRQAKGEGTEKLQNLLIYSLLAIIVTDAAFRNSSSEIIFLRFLNFFLP